MGDMDAWTTAMKDESKSDQDDKKSESDDTLVQLLIERVDHVESKAKRSEEEIKKLKRRISIAEKRISPLDNNHIPWRRIGDEGDSADKCEEGELSARDFKPEEEYQLPRDVYSIVASWKFNTQPFWMSILVIIMQISLLVLLLWDQTQIGGESEFIEFPTNVPSIVHAAQGLATVIAIMDQDDLRSAIEQFFDGPPTRFKGDAAFQRMTKAQWNFSCFVRFAQGFLSVMSAFVLAIQSETVFDVLLNFLGVKFVSELDDLAFGLSQLGYFGEHCQRAAKCIVEAQFQQDDRNKVDESSWNLSWFYKYAHVIGVFCVLALLLGFYFHVYFSQNSGKLAAQIVKLEVAETSVPFAAIFSGCYVADRNGPRNNYRRLPYLQMGFAGTGGKFGFCNDIKGEQAWTFSLGTADTCTQWFGRSEATTTFDILEVGDNSQWFSNDGVLLGSLQISKVFNPASECNTSTVVNTEELCVKLNVEGSLDVTQEVTRSTSFYKAFVNITEPDVFTYQALTNPIYVGSSSTPQEFDLIFFTGQSWVLIDIIQPEATGKDLSMKEYMQNDPEFISILNSTIYFGSNVRLITSTVISSANSHTPLGLRWFRMREKDPRLTYNYPTADESRPVELEVSCATCNNITNPCSYGGICRANKACDCVNGGYGALCRQPPLGDKICNPYFNTEQFDWDGGDCCGGSCNGPQCGLGGLTFPFGIDSKAQEIDEFNILGYEVCEDPKMAPVTIELKDFEALDDEEWNAIVGNVDGDPICSTAAVNVRCDGTTYLHVPQHILPESSCSLSFTETIHVPFGSRCELSTNIACFGIICLDHSISVYYGNDTTSVPIRSGRVKRDVQLSFGIPSSCLTDVLSGRKFSIFDLSTDQGMAANALSNDGLSEFLCGDNRVESRGFILERFALSVFNHSVHFNSSNWEPYQCHGFGIPAFHSKCSLFSITSLILELDATTKVGTIPTEISLLTRLTNLVLRGNKFTGTIPTELGLLTGLGALELWSNNLSGTIPSEIGSLKKLSALAFADNRITGTIPAEILRLSLTGFWVDGNMITGTISSELGRMPLVTLSLNLNRFSGTIPSELFNIPSLSTLGLSYNRLTGSIPEIGNLNLNSLYLQNNFMTGSLPPDIGQMPWVDLNLSNNSFSGEIPPLPEMQICALENNNFTGQAPKRCLV